MQILCALHETFPLESETLEPDPTFSKIAIHFLSITSYQESHNRANQVFRRPNTMKPDVPPESISNSSEL